MPRRDVRCLLVIRRFLSKAMVAAGHDHHDDVDGERDLFESERPAVERGGHSGIRDFGQEDFRDAAGRSCTVKNSELFAYAKAGSLLSILKSKARRTLGSTPKKRTRS